MKVIREKKTECEGWNYEINDPKGISMGFSTNRRWIFFLFTITYNFRKLYWIKSVLRFRNFERWYISISEGGDLRSSWAGVPALSYVAILYWHSRHFDYWNQPLSMRMRVCYLDCHEAGPRCYLVTCIEKLLLPLQLFYFHLWPIYWLSVVNIRNHNIRRYRKPIIPYKTRDHKQRSLS
jgi:hypothetical protein